MICSKAKTAFHSMENSPVSFSTTIDGIDYGPLAALIGKWEGRSGIDTAPEPEPVGKVEEPYFETITFEAGGDLTNASEQRLVIVPYTQIVSRISTGLVFHHQLGYWCWDPQTGVVMQSLTIPRGFALLAGGQVPLQAGYGNKVTLSVRAALGDPDWGIVQSPFMRDKAKTTAFTHTITVDGDSLTYSESTMLNIYGKVFDHTDTDTLKRVQ
jgi:hypothetical protein